MEHINKVLDSWILNKIQTFKEASRSITLEDAQNGLYEIYLKTIAFLETEAVKRYNRLASA